MNISSETAVKEGKSRILVCKNKQNKKGPGSKDKFPFYNPSMEKNRDLSILFTQYFIDQKEKNVDILDGLASSGIRGIRFANEIEGNFRVAINDWSEKAYFLIKKNLEKNNIKNAYAYNKNFNPLVSENRFDYIDIDPFGSPIYFLDSALRSIYDKGVIACTATDTAALCGVYPKVCKRRYDAYPFHSPIMYEVALRILVGTICRNAARYDKGVIPLLCLSNDHYFRVYIKIEKGKKKANECMEKLSVMKPEDFSFFKPDKNVGPLWTGNIQDEKIIKELRKQLTRKKIGTKKDLFRLFDLLESEANAPMFFYTIDDLASSLKVSPPKRREIFKELKNSGYEVCRTHFTPTGFKTDAPKREIEKVMIEC